MAVTLQAQSRSVTGKKVGKLRREGFIPAVLFGKGLESREISVPVMDFSRVQPRISSTTLLDVVVDDGAAVKALLHKIQINPRTGKPVHLELHQVKMDDMIRVEVPIHLEGIAPAVSELNGILVLAHETLAVRCNPNHLISSFHVDVSHLNTFDDHIKIGDIPAPEGVELLADPETVLVGVVAPRIEVEEEIPTEMPEPQLVGREDAAAS